MRRLTFFAVVMLACTLLGCPWGTVSPDEFEREFGARPTFVKPDTVFSQQGMKECLAKLKTAVGGERIRGVELLIYPTYVILLAQDPSKPDHLDKYEFQKGGEVIRTPIKLGSTQEQQFEDKLFNLDKPAIKNLSSLIDRTVRELAIETGEVTSVSIRKTGPPTDLQLEVVVQVKASRDNVGLRGYGSMEYDENGNEVSRNKTGKEIMTPEGIRLAVASLRKKAGPESVRATVLELSSGRAELKIPVGGRLFIYEFSRGRAFLAAIWPLPPDHQPRTFELSEVDVELLINLFQKHGAADGISTINISLPFHEPDPAEICVSLRKLGMGMPCFDLKGRALE